MLSNLLKGLFDKNSVSVISAGDFFICIIISLVLGAIIAACYTYRTKYTKSFLATLAILPAVVCVVIMMVNGNVGTGVAVAGAFSLVRFRSAPGTAKEIGIIFLAMGAGLISGMGYIAYSLLYTLILCAANILFTLLSDCTGKRKNYKTLRVTIPESLDYDSVFDDVLRDYTDSYELTEVKTTNMGSLYKLTYDIRLKSNISEKDMLDKLRCRNGNLEIAVSNQHTVNSEL